MNRVQKFMMGRAGSDQLSIFLLFVAMSLTLLSMITGMGIFSIIGYIPMVLSLYRIFSKDVQKRRMENYKFSMKISPLYSKYSSFKKRAQNRKTHKYFKCSNCKTKLRIPRGSGKVIVTCPNCKLKFIKKR